MHSTVLCRQQCANIYITCLKKNTPFIDNKPGRHWYEGFQKRHPDFSTRTVAQHLTLVRASVTEEDLRGWFQEIGTYLTSKDLLNIHPSRVFNWDETNIQLCPKPEKILAKKGARSVYKVVDANEKESVTSLFMYNAEGTKASPLIIYPYKESVPKKVLENFPSGWGIGISESG
ncbi:TIGD2 protein [Temnothorax longispinosus]|uniref:TIGD2 protein n=1 Tax=Temnothorax longispinosus TaxID=300112 RepID=A0A4S2KB11_9HYME|nr:TIGD2 protein [Temnothorax longispinosus]